LGNLQERLQVSRWISPEIKKKVVFL